MSPHSAENCCAGSEASVVAESGLTSAPYRATRNSRSRSGRRRRRDVEVARLEVDLGAVLRASVQPDVVELDPLPVRRQSRKGERQPDLLESDVLPLVVERHARSVRFAPDGARVSDAPRPRRLDADRPARPDRPRRAADAAREARVPEPRRLGQGPHRARDDRGRRARGEAAARAARSSSRPRATPASGSRSRRRSRATAASS